MKSMSPFDVETLKRQIDLQKRHGWDLEKAFPWEKGIDLSKAFVPLDSQNIAFPGANQEQRLALSQFIGLMVNETISEMENSLPRLKHHAWERTLKSFPVNPEMEALGELFFEEEDKHAKSFTRYLDMMAHELNVERKDLARLLPKAFGSFFQKSVIWNAEIGGHAFWWVVAAVEEISIEVFKAIHKNRTEVDPLYYELHKRHAEEEIRHENYAFLMLDLVNQRPTSMRGYFLKKLDVVLSEIVAGPWVLTELTKFFNVKQFKGVHPFFDTLNSCIPLLEAMPKKDLIKSLIFTSPYVSWLAHPGYRKKHRDMLGQHNSLSLTLLTKDRATNSVQFVKD